MDVIGEDGKCAGEEGNYVAVDGKYAGDYGMYAVVDGKCAGDDVTCAIAFENEWPGGKVWKRKGEK